MIDWLNIEELEQYYYLMFECRFCGKKIRKEELEKHQEECKE